MSSHTVFFKFRNDKEPSTITFDGTSITVFDLKREIIQVRELGDGTDFDLILLSEDGKDEYNDDTTLISRGTTVVARRAPAARPGHGRAQRYVSGTAPITHRKNARAEPASIAKPAPAPTAAPTREPQTEEEKIAQLHQAQASHWKQQQQELATAKYIRAPGRPNKPVNVPDKEPPQGYICYRCHQPGHWIQVCPTNDDPNFEKKPPPKRSTGIPRSFLVKVDPATKEAQAAGLTDERNALPIWTDKDGASVIMRSDDATWNQYQAKAKASQAQQEAAAKGSQELRDRGLECPVDKQMFVDPKKTPCCDRTYCNDCIENSLLENDLVCPNCSTPDIMLEALVADDDMVKRIKEYEQEKANEKKNREASKSPKAQVAEPVKSEAEANPAKTNKSPSPTPADKTSTKSKSPTPPSESGSTSKKRAAEEELVSDRIPSAPAAMRKQQEAEKAAQDAAAKAADPVTQFQQQMSQIDGMLRKGQAPNMNNMPGFPTQMNMMNGMGMGAGFQNPMAMMGAMMGNGMGMPGMPNGMMNPMMMPQQGAWGMNGMNGMGGGFPQQNGMYNHNSRDNNHGYQNGHANGYNNHNQQWQGQQQPPSGPQGWNQNGANGAHGPQNGNAQNQGAFPNQQRTFFSEPLPNEEDNAYFRKPVNPHRHQSRQRRQQRPSDFKEL